MLQKQFEASFAALAFGTERREMERSLLHETHEESCSQAVVAVVVEEQ